MKRFRTNSPLLAGEVPKLFNFLKYFGKKAEKKEKKKTDDLVLNFLNIFKIF